MQLRLNKIVPSFFQPQQGAASEIWRKDIVFEKGSRIHIIAPSGSGKTSLSHFLYGLRNDYNGAIELDSENIRPFSKERFARLRQQQISIVFQDLRLFTDQTVRQNIEIKRILQPFHQLNQIDAMAKRLGIEHKLDQLCSTCSYGEQQRIAIIRSLQQPFDFLLLDEPFSHLDENNRSKAMELIEEEAAARNAAIILADLKRIDYFHSEHIYTM